MTKIIVVSDSHGKVLELEEIYNKYKNDAKYFLHCGDSELDEKHPILKVYRTVNGNCDERSFVDELILEIENKKILIIHGHYYSVKYNLTSLYFYALEKGCDIVLFGHTHYPLCVKHDNLTFINPGSLFANRGIRGKTFAVIEIDSDIVNVIHYDLNFKEIKV